VTTGAAINDDDLSRSWLAFEAGCTRVRLRVERDVARALGVPGPSLAILLALPDHPGLRVTMGALSDEIDRSTGGTTKLADRLEAAGFVERHPDPRDRRVVALSLTDAGRAAARDGVHGLASSLRRHLGELERADVDLAQLAGVLTRAAAARDGGLTSAAGVVVRDVLSAPDGHPVPAR
jgi:MarR family transcriptional regulator, 2-MHQ and catechol-resistance regulon repressor